MLHRSRLSEKVSSHCGRENPCTQWRSASPGTRRVQGRRWEVVAEKGVCRVIGINWGEVVVVWQVFVVSHPGGASAPVFGVGIALEGCVPQWQKTRHLIRWMDCFYFFFFFHPPVIIDGISSHPMDDVLLISCFRFSPARYLLRQFARPTSCFFLSAPLF